MKIWQSNVGNIIIELLCSPTTVRIAFNGTLIFNGLQICWIYHCLMSRTKTQISTVSGSHWTNWIKQKSLRKITRMAIACRQVWILSLRESEMKFGRKKDCEKLSRNLVCLLLLWDFWLLWESKKTRNDLIDYNKAKLLKLPKWLHFKNEIHTFLLSFIQFWFCTPSLALKA